MNHTTRPARASIPKIVVNTHPPCSGGNCPVQVIKSTSITDPFFLFLCFALLASLIPPITAAQALPPPPRTAYYLHGRIYTNDPQHPWATAMAVREGKIVCIGGIEQIMLECGGGNEDAETIQLGGKFVMPGFNDAHVHLGSAATRHASGPPQRCSLHRRTPEARSRCRRRHKEGDWITAAAGTTPSGPTKNSPPDSN